jgi:hypothetical protein
MAASRAKRAEVADRRSKAVALRLSGASFETIAALLGYTTRGAACQDITRALEASLAEQSRSADVLREAELLRLDLLQVGAWAAAADGDPKAIEVVLKIVDRRCKLLGLDAPQRHEVITLDAVDAEIARLTAELGRDETAAAAGVETASD